MPIMQLPTLTTPPTPEAWNTAQLANAQTLGLPTTAWQPGQPERVIFATTSLVAYDLGISNSLIAQGGFLSFAATGFVNYIAPDGTQETLFVTPDPSIPAQNPDGALGWLDVLADGQYDVQRILNTKAGGVLAFVNTQPTTYGPFGLNADGTGTYHAAQATGEGYSNTASFSIPQSTVIDTVTNVVTSGGLIEVTTSGAHGLSDGDIVAILDVTGIPALTGTTAWSITITSSTEFTLDNSTFSGVYTGGGTVYDPTLAPFTADVAGTQNNALAESVNVPVTSLIGVTCANYADWTGTDVENNPALAARCKLKLAAIAVGSPTAAIEFYALTAQQLAPTLTPAQSLSSANTRALATLDTLTGTITCTIANAGGAPAGGDVTATQAVLDAYIGIIAYTTTVQAAANNTVAVVINAFVPAAFNTQATTDLFTQAVLDYFRALPIGGLTLTGGTSPDTNVVPYDAVLGSVFLAAQAAAIPMLRGDVQGTLDGGVVNVQLLLSPVPEVAIPNITVNLVST